MCPECREPMIAYELEGVEIDRCLRCSGTWLDAGELEMITELAGASPGEMARALEAKAAEKKSTRRCPRCGGRLEVVHVGSRNPVEIDRCPRGHGLWLDAGEMELVIAGFEDGEEGAVARYFSRLYRKDARSSPPAAAAGEGGTES